MLAFCLKKIKMTWRENRALREGYLNTGRRSDGKLLSNLQACDSGLKTSINEESK
jgi:hypothetical protein